MKNPTLASLSARWSRFTARLDATAQRLTTSTQALDLHRAWPVLLVAVVLLLIVVNMNSVKLGTSLNFYSRLCGSAFAGYWVDRLINPYARPHALDGIDRRAAMKRRAWIVAACILAGGWAQ